MGLDTGVNYGKMLGQGAKKGMESAKLEATLWGSAEHAAHMAEYAAGAHVRAMGKVPRVSSEAYKAHITSLRGLEFHRMIRGMKERAEGFPGLQEEIRHVTKPKLGTLPGEMDSARARSALVTSAHEARARLAKGRAVPSVIASVPPEELDRGNVLLQKVVEKLTSIDGKTIRGATLKAAGIA